MGSTGTPRGRDEAKIGVANKTAQRRAATGAGARPVRRGGGGQAEPRKASGGDDAAGGGGQEEGGGGGRSCAVAGGAAQEADQGRGGPTQADRRAAAG